MEYYILYNGGKIYYTDLGSGETVVLIHGYLESAEIWSDFAKRLSTKFRVISVNLPGHGRSAVYSDCHTMEFMAAAVKSMFDNLHLKDVFLVGHSMGGYVTLAFVDLFPELLKGYCLFHSQPFADLPAAVQKREHEIENVRSGRKYMLYPDNIPQMFSADNIEKLTDALERSNEIASHISDEGIVSVLNGMKQRPSRVSVMEEGRVPCLWILGKKDNYISFETVQGRVKLPANAKVVVLENSGHMGFVEEEGKSAEIISDYLTGLSSK